MHAPLPTRPRRPPQRRCDSDNVQSSRGPHVDRDSETARLLDPGGEAACGGTSEQRTPGQAVRRWAAAGRRIGGWVVPTTDVQRVAVFKAVLAYALAALFAFVPALRDFLGDPEYMTPHLVANATIWYHAAKTRSGLAEGGLIGAVWVCTTSAVTYVALFIAEWLHIRFARDPAAQSGMGGTDADALPLALPSKLVSLGVFIFGYSWCLALFKANANRPSVSTATAIANVALYLVMLREAPVVNYKVAVGATDGERGRLPWPGGEDSLGESVGKKTEHVLVAVLAGMAISLAVGWVVRPTTAGAALRKQLGAVLESFRDILPQLLAPIVDGGAAPARSERRLRGAKPEELKSALRTHRQQLQQLKKQLEAAALEPTEWHVWARRRRLAALLACLDGLSLHLGGMSVALELHAGGHCESTDAAVDGLDAAAYEAVVQRIRAPVMRLGHACDKALAAVHSMIDAALDGRRQPAEAADSVDLVEARVARLRYEISAAVQMFHEDYDRAVHELGSLPGDTGECAAGATAVEERLYIVHFFVLSLREFVGELLDILPIVAAVCRPPPPLALAAKQGLQPRSLWAAARSLGGWVLVHFRMLWDTGATTELELYHESAQSLHAPRPTGWLQRAARAVWRVLMWARRPNVRFATKYALLVTLLSLPCYWSIDVYLEFRRQRMDWMVISAAAIMVPTVGGSALVSVYRVLGTCAGGLVAFVVYETSQDAPVVTYVLLVLFSVPCFHIMLHGRYPKIGQFALITFGVVLISKCIAREDQAESAGELAARRTASVALGVLAGMAATMYVWPFEARVRVRQALSWWLLTASRLYEQLWCTLWLAYAAPAHALPASGSAALKLGGGDEECAVGGPQHPDTVRDYLDSELRLQGALLEIRSLLSDTLNEPRLKGRFPMETYQRIINASQRVLDTMVAARWVMLPVPTAEVLEPPADECGQGAATAPNDCASDDAGEDERLLLDLPAEVLVPVVQLRREQLDAGATYARHAESDQTAASSPLGPWQGQPVNYSAAAGDAAAEDGEQVSWLIRRRVERDLLRRTAAERMHRDSLVSLTMYVLASALVLKSPLPAMLPPVEAAQQQVARAMRSVLDMPADPDVDGDGSDAEASERVRRVVARARYVFYYLHVILGRQIVHELAIITGLMRELYGSTRPAPSPP
ncbi:hypothetical protein LPJ61_001251 [Coemansia biformis]|uniref:DUF2421 domain-containing protein n=1 Tax=Coemansia biformis TaxID=1286918 RepID=A0A9W7YFJ0_9FUNG|nr:hypothetical protein LPJ61_001251 [Coemansia biformis]